MRLYRLIAKKELIIYQQESGKEPFSNWLSDLDKTIRVRIRSRLDRVEQGHDGGDGDFELRIFIGPGYRVSFAEDWDTIVLLLHGGDKRSQSKDIAKAQDYWKSYQALKVKEAKEKKENESSKPSKEKK